MKSRIMKHSFNMMVAAAVALAFSLPALGESAIERDCESVYSASGQSFDDMSSLSAGQYLIAKRKAIEKCVREVTRDLAQDTPGDCTPELPQDRDAYRKWLISELERLAAE